MEFSVGEKVSLQVPLPYLKTADAISMLRPPDLVSLDEVGVIIGIRANNLSVSYTHLTLPTKA